MEVGASHLSVTGKQTANEGELVFNIQTALQTSSMIKACKVATKAWIVALFAALASMLSAMAAWAAIWKSLEYY